MSASSSAPVGAPTWSSMTLQPLALRGEPQHRLGEVAAARAVDPARAQDQVPAAAGADRLFAFELGAAVDVERAGAARPRRAARRRCRRTRSRCCSGPARRRSAAASRASAPAASALIVRASVGLALGLVDGGVGGGIDDHVRPHRAHRRGERIGPREVAASGSRLGEVERDHLAERRQRALQLPADLAVLAEEQDLHAACRRRSAVATQSR